MSSVNVLAPNPSPFISGVCGSVSLEGKEGYAVKQHTDDTWIICGSQGEKGFVLVSGGGIGKPVTVAGPGAQVPVYVSAALASGSAVTPGTTGAWEVAASADYVCATLIQTSTASGDYVMAVTQGPTVL